MIADNVIAGSNAPVLTVSELSHALKRTVEDAYGFVRVRGEISQPKRHASGHVYMRLKDEATVLEAVCWRGAAAKLAVRPEEGLEVVVTGRLTTYPGRSQYQLVIETMELAGEGALLKMLEERRKRLAAEGLFDPERKRPLPFLPEVVGVVTSPTGAVIRDILHRLADRFPRHVLLWPVAVQGEGAAPQVAAAIRGFNAIAPGGPVPRPDVLIVARGGGSLEDLMAFNEEAVVRAAAESRIPLISAVGHETDTTLIDHAADVRAPTPTAAAEMAVPVRAHLLEQVLDDARRLYGGLARTLDERRMRVEGLARGLGEPMRLIEGHRQRLDDRAERLALCARAYMEKRAVRTAELGARLRHPSQLLTHAESRFGAVVRQFAGALRQSVTVQRGRFETVAIRLRLRPLMDRTERGGVALADLDRRLDRAYAQRLDDAGRRVSVARQLLDTLSHKGVLKRGYAYVTAADGQPVVSAAEAAPGRALTLHFQDGQRGAVVGGGGEASAASSDQTAPAPAAPLRRASSRGPSKPAVPKAPAGPRQGSLF
ncbi:MAG TPA: exodeoxyribonuclease VII large subunit [Azospirillaceae bacterium]|nr:exodeoxyribonuclease VII large subunit [Azospirillaceae bacterium]